MLRPFYGLQREPFDTEGCPLLPQQQEIYDILRVHCQQGGLCLVLGVPGLGKSMIKEHLKAQADSKRVLVATVARSLHTYPNTIRILCQAVNIEFAGASFKCEKRLIEHASSLDRQGKSLVIIIDDAHLLEMEVFRRLRLLFEEFPKNHNVILVGQPPLMDHLGLGINEDIRSRVTYSVLLRRLNPDDMQAFLLAQLDHCGLGHNVFTEGALNLIVRSSEGVLRKARNLCLACLLEGLHTQTRAIDIDVVNRMLIQPHWRKDNNDLPQ
jgi:MSHA biogenesis protein MshM